MNTWKSIFAQSPVNSGYYDEYKLPHCNWDWPKGTWFQARPDIMRERQPAWGHQHKKIAGNLCAPWSEFLTSLKLSDALRRLNKKL